MAPTLGPVPRPFSVPRNLRLLNALAFFSQFNAVIAIWVVYLTDYRDLTLAQVGLMEGLFWAVKLVLEIPSGAFADRYGRRLANIVGVTIEGSGVVVFALAGEFWLLVLSYVLWSGGMAFRSGNDDAYLYDTLAADERTKEYGDRHGVMRALGIVAFSISGVIGGVVAAVFDLQVGILTGAATYAVSGVVIAFMQEPPRMMTIMGTPGSVGDTLATAWRAVRADPALRWIIALEVALAASFPAHFLLAQPFLERHDVPLALFGVLEVPTRLAGAAALLLSARWARRVGLGRGLLGAIVLPVVGLVLLSSLDHVWAFAGFALIQVGTGLAFPVISAYVNARTESHVRATILSISPLGVSLSYAVLGPVVGVAGASSLQAAFGLMALLIGVTSGAVFMAWRAADRRAPVAV